MAQSQGQNVPAGGQDPRRPGEALPQPGEPGYDPTLDPNSPEYDPDQDPNADPNRRSHDR